MSMSNILLLFSITSWWLPCVVLALWYRGSSLCMTVMAGVVAIVGYIGNDMLPPSGAVVGIIYALCVWGSILLSAVTGWRDRNHETGHGS